MSRPLRVGFWSPVLNYVGGTETWHLTLFEQLADDPRIQIVGLAVLDPTCCNPAVASQLTLFAPVSSGPESLTILAATVDVLVMWGIAHPDQLIDPRKDRPRCVFVCHGEASSAWQTGSAEAAAAWVDRFVAVSEWARLGVPEAKRAAAAVIPNGVDPYRLAAWDDRKSTRQHWGVPAGKQVVGFLGRCSVEKDPWALVRAVAALPEDWVGVLVGGGEDRNAVRADSFVYAPGRVYFPGPTHQVGSALKAFDVLLVPSREEGFCFSAVEAVLARVPVVMTPVGVAREHPDWFQRVPIGATGDVLAAAVIEADRSDHSTPSPLIRRQRAAERLYSVQAMGQRWADLLCEVATS